MLASEKKLTCVTCRSRTGQIRHDWTLPAQICTSCGSVTQPCLYWQLPARSISTEASYCVSQSRQGGLFTESVFNGMRDKLAPLTGTPPKKERRQSHGMSMRQATVIPMGTSPNVTLVNCFLVTVFNRMYHIRVGV